MTEIQNSKPQHHLKKESQICWVIETGDPPAGWGVRRTNIGI